MLYYKYMEEQNIADEYKVRLSKLNKLKKDGYTPYKKNFKITHFIGDIKELDVNDFRDKELVLKKPKDFCSVAGRVITIRNHGKIIFMDVSDTKGTVQVAIKNDCIDKKSLDFFYKFFVSKIIYIKFFNVTYKMCYFKIFFIRCVSIFF